MDHTKVKPFYNWEKYLQQNIQKPESFSETIKSEDQCMISLAAARAACLIALQEGREEEPTSTT